MRNLVIGLFTVILLTGCAVKQNLPPPATPPSAKSPTEINELSTRERIAGLSVATGLVNSLCDMTLRRPKAHADKDKFARILGICSREYSKILGEARKIKAENRNSDYDPFLDQIVDAVQAMIRAHDENRDCIVKSANAVQMKTCLDKLGPKNTK